MHESSVEWFRYETDIENDWGMDQLFEGAVIHGDARNLRYVASDSVVEWKPSEDADQSVRFLPVFLKDTKRHNALWLYGLRSRSRVTVVVEKVIPVMARFLDLSQK